ncbi:hypothetical protein ABTM58_21010, partial [Acinetobacter baumannii]
MTERPELTQKLEVASAVSMVELEATIRLLDGEDGPYRAHAVIKNDAQGGTNLDISVNGGPIKTEKLAFQELD